MGPPQWPRPAGCDTFPLALSIRIVTVARAVRQTPGQVAFFVPLGGCAGYHTDFALVPVKEGWDRASTEAAAMEYFKVVWYAVLLIVAGVFLLIGFPPSDNPGAPATVLRPVGWAVVACGVALTLVAAARGQRDQR